MRDDVSPRLIDLALEPAFALAGLEVRPASLEVLAGERREQLEPRIMQVLVALAGHRGEVVSRDELIQRCWGGRVVGDDSINRCIFRLRKLAEAMGGFEIVTVARVGFRLSAEASPPTVASPDSAGAVVLAVLAFDNLSSDPDLVFFSDGVSEEILHAVSRRAGVKVIGRSSSFSLRAADKSAKNVVRVLGATHLLDGSVRRHADKVRVSVELVECANQTSVWSAQFDLDLSDILAMQDEIASAVAVELRVRFTPPLAAQKIAPRAYDLFLRSRSTLASGNTPPSRGIAMLEVVVALAPQFAPAWAALAQFRVEAFRGIALDSVQLSVKRADVVAAANRALELDPGEGLVHVTLAHLLPWGDYRGREAAFDRAIKATDGLTAARTEMGWFLTSAGRNEEALRITAEGCKLDPFNARVANLYSQMLCATGRYNESIQAFVGFRRRWPDLFIFVNVPLLLAASVGDWPEADRLIEIAQRHHGTIRYLPDTLRRVAALREPSRLRRERILELLHKQVAATRAIDLAFLTLAHQMGLVEETFDLIEEASFDQINSEGGPAPAYSFSPGIIFDRTTNLSLIEDPRFVRLCDKLGLCDYWIESGHWPDCARFVPYNFKGEARRQVQQRS